MSASEKQQTDHASGDLNAATDSLTKFLRFLKDHYASLAAIFTVIFTASCLFLSITFYQAFGIEISSFSSFLDIYKTIFSNASWERLAIFSVLGTMLVASRKVVTNVKFPIEKTHIIIQNNRIKKKSSHGRLERYLIKIRSGITVITVTELIVFSLPYIFVLLLILIPPVPKSVELIKLGVANRYDIKTTDTVYKCHAMLGSSSDYLFLWNYDTKQATVIPRSKLHEIKVLFIAPTKKFPPETFKISESQKTKWIAEVKNERQKWAKDVYTACKQSIASSPIWEY